MIRFDNVSLSYGDRTVLSGVTLHVPPGGRAALMGPSGCGKTSMLDLAAGLLAPAAGAGGGGPGGRGGQAAPRTVRRHGPAGESGPGPGL